MAKFTLHIETEDAFELARLVDRLAGSPDLSDALGPSTPMSPLAEAEKTFTNVLAQPEEPKRGRGRPPKTEKPQEPAQADPAVTTTIMTPETRQISVSPENREPVVISGNITAGQTVSGSGGATYDDLKGVLARLIGAKGNAADLQRRMKEELGVPSLSQLKPEQYDAAFAKLKEWENG